MGETSARWLTYPKLDPTSVDISGSFAFIESYKALLSAPITFIDPCGQPYEMIPNATGVQRRCDILYNLLCNDHGKNRKAWEATARGFLVEMAAVAILNTIAQDFPGESGYRVFHTLPQIDYDRKPFETDNGYTRKDKGGDAILVQEVYEEGVLKGYRPIAVLDAKASKRNSDTNIAPGFNCRLRECVPVIVGCFGGMGFADTEGELHPTRSYLINRVVPAMALDKLPRQVYWPTKNGPHTPLFFAVREEITNGCEDTIRHLKEKSLRVDLNHQLVEKIRIAHMVLGDPRKII